MFTIQEKIQDSKGEGNEKIKGEGDRKGQQERPSEKQSTDTSPFEMLIAPSILQDVALHRKQVRFLTKTALALTNRVYEQQEKMNQLQNKADLDRREHESISSQNQSLKNQIAKLTERCSKLETELQERSGLIEESTAEEQRASSIRQTKLKEFQRHAMNLLQQNQEQASTILQLQEGIKMKDAEIERLKQRCSHLQKCNLEASDRQSLKDNEVATLKAQLIQTSHSLQKAMEQHQQIEQVIIELQRELQELKQSRSEEVTENFKKGQEHSQLKGKLEAKFLQLSQLRSKYKSLKKNYSQLQIQCNYIKQRYQQLTSDQRDIEHVLIDGFVHILQILTNNLKKAEAKNIKISIDCKKTAILKRLQKQYEQFIVKLQQQ